jgi:transposase
VVSALRSKRGLRPAGRNAEPQVVGLTPQTTVMTERANTMKTYLLRNPHPVEPQKSPRSLRTQPLTPPRLAGPPPGPALFIGLDVHNDSIAVSLAPSHSTEVRRYGILGGQHDDVLKLLKKLSAAHPGLALKCCYEAGPRGYPLCRFVRQHGAECIIVSPSKVPRQPGDRVKTDRRDADQLARLFRAGELTGIYVPDPQDEAVRDLIRARYQVQKQQHRARQQLKMFLLRQNIRYAGTKPWTAAHLGFLATVKLPFGEQQFVFQEMVHVISEAGQRLARYEKQIECVVEGWRWQPVVKALMSLRGVALLTAATLVAELGDLNRFASAPQLMSYLGLVPGEHSSGSDRQQGGITKMGNGIARKAMIEAAWNNSRAPRISRTVLARQEGLPPAVTQAAWNAQIRLHQRYKHLTGVGRKKSQVAAAALGRELSGFVWAIGRRVKPRALKIEEVKPAAA